MADRYEVVTLAVGEADALPSRLTDHTLHDLLEALKVEIPDGADPRELTLETFRTWNLDRLAAEVLDVLLLKPPIPAGCEALVRGMRDAARPPWMDHEVVEDQLSLWLMHYLLHLAMPEQFPAPRARAVSLDVTNLDPEAVPPGKRSPLREKASFMARVLAQRSGDNPMAARFGQGREGHAPWAFDVVWEVEVGARRAHTAEEVAARGLPEGSRVFTTRMVARLPAHWLGALEPGARWTCGAYAD